MKYYIYHVLGVKIGCSTNVKRRVLQQGFATFEILEEHEDIEFASQRERELQKMYGLPIDDISYVESKRAQRQRAGAGGKAAWQDRDKMMKKVFTEKTRKAQSDQMKKYQSSLTSEQVSKRNGLAGKAQLAILRICPHCGKEGRGFGMSAWHFNKCKFKPTTS